MEKNNPLLPFAFTRSTSGISNEVHLDTTPRPRAVIDENASSMYHTRTPDTKKSFARPTLTTAPGLKRRVGESFNEKDDIKRRVTAFEGLDSDEPTMIDTTSTDFSQDELFQRSFLDGESAGKSHYETIPPSSPPIDTYLSSEYDPYAKFSMPLSPSQRINSDAHYGSSPSKPSVVRLDSETDFGIDKFNRFRPPENQCPSTDRDFSMTAEAKEERKKMIYSKARDIVIAAFEDMKTSIDLESMGLNEVPSEIKDLNDLVVIGQDSTQIIFQLYLTNNDIRVLGPPLFKFTKLNVLALRQNKIERIPALIKNMVRLTDLSIGANRIKFLPWQILNLPVLQSFRAGPNPFLKVPNDAIEIKSMTLNPIKNKRFVSRIEYFKDDEKLIPSLKSLCLSKIAQYDVSYQEARQWRKNTPRLYHESIKKAIAQGNFEETCAECDRLITDPVAEVIEWWDFLQNNQIPFKKEFCSGMCVKRYSRRVIEDSDSDEL
ncbi:hypothetical protein PSN45_004954 [Yamadazyma tenuis]|uniref:L domain-like protein n=1 Tax=Candida tenuis (strain ATCC 10573 / BCRC 21748 / CBS 615 / JCM 9827 / NBRC 10315 / NRRL Y-1498 / VKM Y-70) TaxID=590646 RepID=G3B296_CANTC|nr:uncharacterized protein CANTEDRAFT_120380 [Yamadazyma tenuis ATCC 10573]EGV64624.1 hypothetical protein CANTEDRAFT_120380 [Yamadazyma tenuis ATCC 10573]WEJ97403.1 hypothetical protein PSN45_004954 [Yamadazyma tenuis]